MRSQLLTWSDKYQTGIAFADTQHKQLLEAMNRLHQALADGKGKLEIGKTLNELMAYAQAHFAAEEQVLQRCGYADSSAHHCEHECLAYAMLEFYQNMMGNETATSTYVAQFFRKWVATEILEVDMKFVPFLKSMGVH